MVVVYELFSTVAWNEVAILRKILIIIGCARLPLYDRSIDDERKRAVYREGGYDP